MNTYGIGSSLTAASSFGFGLLVLIQSSNKPLAQRWFLFVSSVAIWGIFGVLISLQKNAQPALILWRTAHAVGAIWIAPLFYHFVSHFLGHSSRRFIRLHYGIGFLCAIMASTRAFIPYVKWVCNAVYVGQAGWFYSVYSVWWWGVVIYCHFLLARAQQNATQAKKNQIRYFFLATTIGFSGGILNYLPIYGLNIFPWGQCTIPLYPLIMSYAMLKHQLFDIHVIIRKTLVYSMATLSLTIIYVALLAVFAKLLERWAGAPSMYSSVIPAAIIALLFHPVRTRIQTWLDRQFPRESLNQDILREATGRFVHEIKRPLANISMPAQLALMDLDFTVSNPAEFDRMAPKLRERLNYIIEESLKAGQKIEAIQNVSLEAAVQRDVVDLGKLVSRLIMQDQSRIEGARIELNVRGTDRASCTLGNSAQLEIAIGNVMKNAIDALSRLNSAQSRRLFVRLSGDSEWIAVEIEDSGDGIPPADLPRLFDPWFSTKGSGGMGIGLYLTREILRLHGARVEVQSRPGSTQFRMTFQSGASA